MKNQFLITFMCILFILPAAAKDVKISFYVNGKCGMCEERIENALDIKGIKFADWSKRNQNVYGEIQFRYHFRKRNSPNYCQAWSRHRNV